LKKFIQAFGDSFISFIVAISYIVVVMSGFAAMKMSMMYGLMLIIGGVMSITMIFYVLFILIDIRDSLRTIKEQKL